MYKLRVLATFTVDSVQLYIDVQVWCTSNFLHLTYLGVQAEPVDAKIDHGEWDYGRQRHWHRVGADIRYQHHVDQVAQAGEIIIIIRMIIIVIIAIIVIIIITW